MRAMCGVQLKDRKGSMDLMLMLGLNEIIYQFSMANCVCWYGYVLRREDGHVLRKALDFEVVGQRMKERLKIANPYQPPFLAWTSGRIPTKWSLSLPPGGRDCWLPHDSGAGLCWQHVGGVGSTTTTRGH